MMPNVSRGDRMYGLVNYLAGPGRANEHTNPHLVAGDPFIESWFYDHGELGPLDVKTIAHHLDEPRRQFGVEVPRGNVWHCSLSIRAEEGELTDEKWAAIAHDFIKSMGFDDQDGARAPMRWAAIRHGLSKAGNDHVHLAVQLVRDDGTKADLWRDWPRAQKIAGELEIKYGLEELVSRQQGKTSRGHRPGEREAQARAHAKARYERERPVGSPVWRDLTVADRAAKIDAERGKELTRVKLARGVRAAAAGSRSEAEFVRRLRRQGLKVRPRFAEGSLTTVTGFSIAARPLPGEPTVWYGGKRLAHDLSLPRLRAESLWPDTNAANTEASAEWQAAYRGQSIVRPGAEPLPTPTPELFDQFRHELKDIKTRLQNVPAGDTLEWARIARQASGIYASWSAILEKSPGPLARASDAIATQASTRTYNPRVPRNETVSFTGTAILLATAARVKDPSVSQLLIVNELIALTMAIAKAARTVGDERAATRILTHARTQLADVRQRFDAHKETTTPAAAQEKPKRVGLAARFGARKSEAPAPAAPAQAPFRAPTSTAELPREMQLPSYTPPADSLRKQDGHTAESILAAATPGGSPTATLAGTRTQQRVQPSQQQERDSTPEL